jgi:protein-S-isoprenylcysteine O-methyltransferase Ste14
VWHPLTVSSVGMRVGGATLLVAATAFTLWARVVLGTMWSVDVAIKEHHTLRISGPYRLTRHPIYTGLLSMLAGWAIALGFGQAVAIAAAISVAIVFKARAEERLLTQRFPDDYPPYRRRVPMLVPRLRVNR